MHPEMSTNGLVDLLDRLLDTGVGVGGDVTLAVAGVDLVRLRLNTLLASVEAEERTQSGARRARDQWVPPPRRRRRRSLESLPPRVDAEPESLERGLAQLVYVLADLLAELMERQAIRRMRAGSLSRTEVERLSAAFEALDDRLEKLAEDLGVALESSPAPALLPAVAS
jgi:Gas vesicle protein K/Gas vesicle protein